MLNYNKDLFDKFRALAITTQSDLRIGEKYFSNGWIGSRVLKAIETFTENYAKDGLIYYGDYPDKPEWLRFEDGGSVSMRDSNIGASHNCWLIFKNENLALAAKDLLKMEKAND